MQLSSDVVLDAYLAQNTKVINKSVRVDWNKNGAYDHILSDVSALVKKWRIERKQIGNLPKEASLQSGADSAELTLTLTGVPNGQTQDISQLLSGWNSTSPFYLMRLEGASIVADVRVTPDTGGERILKQFTGKIRSIDASSSGIVTIIANDASEVFRQLVTLPSSGLDKSILDIYGNDYRWPTNSHWVVDYIFRACGFYQSPPAPAGTVFAATLHGGFAAEVGWGGLPNGTTNGYRGPAWVAGKFGLAPVITDRFGVVVGYQATAPYNLNTQGYAFRAWVKFGPYNVFQGVSAPALIVKHMRGDDSGLFLYLLPNGTCQLLVLGSNVALATFTSPAPSFRRNMSSNPSYENDLTQTSSSVGVGGSISRSSVGVAQNGSWYATISATAPGTITVALATFDTTEFANAGYVVGSTYTWSFYVRFRGVAASNNVTLHAAFWTNATLISEVTAAVAVPDSPDTSGAFTRISVTGAIPATTTRVSFFYTTSAVSTGDTFDWDSVMISPGALDNYFDGSFPDTQWSGTPHASKSGEVAWHHVGFFWKRGGADSTARWQIDAINSGAQTVAHGSIGGVIYTLGETTLSLFVSMQCVAFWTIASEPAWTTSWTSQADIDTGLNELTALPVAENLVSWEVLKDVVKAEFGVVGVDESLRPFFLNRDTVSKESLVVDRVVQPTGPLKQISTRTDVATVRNIISYQATPSYIDYFANAYNSTSATYFDTYANSTQSFLIYLVPGVAQLFRDGPMTRVTAAGWGDSILHGYCSVRGDDPATEVSTGIIVSTFRQGNRLMRVDVANTNVFPVRLALPNGEPAFRIGASLRVESATETGFQFNQDSINTYGPQPYALDGSDWRTSTSATDAIAASLLADLRRPSPALSDLPVIGDPRTQLRDLWEIRDPQGLGSVIRIKILGLITEFSDRGLSQTLTVCAAAPPGAWVLGDPIYSVLGSTTRLV